VWTACAVYSIWINPETVFWKYAISQKMTWAHSKILQNQGKVVFLGDSSCAFSIISERLLQNHGIRSVNMGGPAGSGALFLTAIAFNELSKGDTLIVDLTTGFLRDPKPLAPTQLGIQLAMALGQPSLAAAWDLTGDDLEMGQILPALRPGAYHFFTMMGKLIARRPPYRYAMEDVRPDGWMCTTYQEEPVTPNEAETSEPVLSNSGVDLLQKIKELCDARGISVAYSLPWAYTSAAAAQSARFYNHKLLMEIRKIIPVLQDERLGVITERDCFSDTSLHLSSIGANLRTDTIASQIFQWRGY
jgi:hypothetical protein